MSAGCNHRWRCATVSTSQYPWVVCPDRGKTVWVMLECEDCTEARRGVVDVGKLAESGLMEIVEWE